VAPGTHAPRRSADPDSGEQRLDLRAERLERRPQQQILLEAVATAAFGDKLALDVIGRERDRYAALRVEVLERDRGDVRAVDLGDRRCAGQADPSQIAVEVKHWTTLVNAVRAWPPPWGQRAAASSPSISAEMPAS
jgi:hypothetical protein